MPDKKGNLFLFEAIELRAEYDRHIRLFEKLSDGGNDRRESFLSASKKDEDTKPAEGFDPKVFEEKMKRLQTKRIKLNQAIQTANFNTIIEHDGEKISLAEALEIRKNLMSNHTVLAQRVTDSAHLRIIHKEERDIEQKPRYPFSQTYEAFQISLKKIRQIVTQIHVANHEKVVLFKDE